MARRINIGGRNVTDRKTITAHPLPREKLGAFAEAEFTTRRRYDFAATGERILIELPELGYTFEWALDHAPQLGMYGVAPLPDSPALPRPVGCDRMFYVFRPARLIRNDSHQAQECWYGTSVTLTRSLFDFVYRADTEDFPDELCMGNHVMSVARRPTTKVRFPSTDYFIPFRNILYKGYTYR